MSSRTGLSSTGATEDQARSAEPRRNRIGIGKIVVLSLGVGLAAAVLLPFIPWPTVDANFATAMVLFGFAVGWALLAALSVRLTDQPQRWAYAPALFMGVSAVLLLFLPDAVLGALDWVWPPALLVLVAWVYRHAKRDLRSRTRTWLLNPVLAVLVLFALGGAYQTIGRAMEPRVAMRGELVDVGPYRLHLECTGTGAPTVIVEPGGGASAATLGLIAPDVARHTTVCIYDRAGKGWSDAAQTAPDGAQIATDLHTLLERADVPGPYVLAGHSFGGLYVMRYASQYPDEVAGMVLIDSTAPNTNPVPPTTEGSDSFLKHFSALVSATARLGMGRLLGASAMEMASFIDEFVVANRSASEAGDTHEPRREALDRAYGRARERPWMDREAGRDRRALDQQPAHRRARSNPSVPRRQPDPRRRRQPSDRRRRRGDTDRSATRDSVTGGLPQASPS